MFCYIFRMRAAGHRLAGKDLSQQVPAHGWLEFKRSPLDSYGPRMEAHLLDKRGGKDLLLPLYYARLARIDGVMHLAGQERIGRTNTKASSRRVNQSWLCAQEPADALPLLTRVHVVSATGFGPESDHDDDDPYAPLDYQ